MEVPTTTTEAQLSSINESLVQLRVSLGRIAARQEQMLVDLKKMTAALAPTATATPTFVSDPVLEKQTTKPSSPLLFSVLQAVGAGIPHTDAVFASTMPTRCSTSGLGVSSGRNHAAVAFPSLINTEATLAPVELSLDKPLQSCIDLKFNMTLGSRQANGGVDHDVMALNTGVMVAAYIDPSETLPIPEKPILTMCSTTCLGNDASRAMSMVPRGISRTTNMPCVFTYSNPMMLFVAILVCDNVEDVAAYVLFEKVLQRDEVKWKPWPPDLPVWVRHKKPICRPRSWLSFACNQLEGVHMTLARLPWRRPYLGLPTETLAMLKCLHTVGTHLLVLWWSSARRMEH